MIGEAQIWWEPGSWLSLLPWTGRGKGRMASVCAYCLRMSLYMHPSLHPADTMGGSKEPVFLQKSSRFHHQPDRALARILFSDLCLLSSEPSVLIVWWLFCGILGFFFLYCFEEGVWCNPLYMLQLEGAPFPSLAPLFRLCLPTSRSSAE